jgi:nucleotide-binding universal stress UspA family protein
VDVVLAALDDSPMARPVVGTAYRVGKLVGAPVQGLHVGTRLPARLRSAAVPIRLLRGDVVGALVAAGDRPGVAAMVIGARGDPDDPRPLGGTAMGVATGLGCPVVVVPPAADPHVGLERILVPLEGTAATSVAPQALIGLAGTATLDVVVLHVLEPDRLPSFTDQPQHEQLAWAREFVARYCPWGMGTVRLLTRVGHAEDLIPLVAREAGRGLIVLGWSQRFSPDRARVVRAVLRRTPLPVGLVPLTPSSRGGAHDGDRARRVFDQRPADRTEQEATQPAVAV